MEPRASLAETDAGVCKALVRRVVEEAVNGGNFPVLDELLAPDVQGSPPSVHGRTRVKELLALYREAVPDAHWQIDGQIADGEMVATTFTATGRQSGPLWGLPATGRQMSVAGTLFCRCRNGRIVDGRLQLDLLSLLEQLGIMPELDLWHEVLVARLVRESFHGRAD